MIETVSPDTLTLDPENARKHPEENLAAIRDSLKRFGQVLPIVVRNGVVVGGNGTLTVIRDLGWPTVKVVRFEGTETEARALAIALNRSADLATWDLGQLAKTTANPSETRRTNSRCATPAT